MRIAILGTGYVGLVTGVCFADLGNEVICVDIDAERVERLTAGELPLYEPGLEERLERAREQGRISFTTDTKGAVADAAAVFICVGTPPAEGGAADLSAVLACAEQLGSVAAADTVIVVKSTVPVGTSALVEERIMKGFTQRKLAAPSVVSNPEFLREGAAVNDFFNPDRVIVGLAEKDTRGKEVLARLYKGVARTTRPIIFCDRKSAELIKYASNAMLATRISFVNQLSHYCEAVGADITAVTRGMGLDTRIGPRFLHAGVGYGGSCFPKDVQGLIAAMRTADCPATLFEAVHAINEEQKRSLFPKVKELLGTLTGKTVAVWGLSFKPKTDDVREAPSLTVVPWLLEQGCSVRVFDPEALENFKKHCPEPTRAQSPYDAVEGADVLLLLTEWDLFRNPDWERIAGLMRSKNIVDGRNIYLGLRDELTKLGFAYRAVGVPDRE